MLGFETIHNEFGNFSYFDARTTNYIEIKNTFNSRFNNTIKFVNRTNDVNITMEHGLILMSWDGVSRSVFLELLYNGYLPNINKLNVYNMIDNKEYDAQTCTAPQHSIMLSGYLANIIGTTTNGKITPLESKSLFVRIKNAKPKCYIAGLLTKPNFVGIPLLGKKGATYLYGIGIRGEFKNYMGFNYVESKAIYLNSTSVINKVGGKGCANVEALRIAEVNHNEFFYFFHIADPDETGHEYSSYSDEYRQAIVNTDTLLGELMEKFPKGTVFIVTSDHGFDGYNHVNTPNTFLASNIILRNAHEVDISPTIYNLLRINESFTSSLNGKSLILNN